MSSVCSSYLNTTGLFLSEESQPIRLQQIISGRRALHRYCFEHWNRHVSLCIDHKSITNSSVFTACVLKLGSLRWLFKNIEHEDIEVVLKRLNAFQEEMMHSVRTLESPASKSFSSISIRIQQQPHRSLPSQSMLIERSRTFTEFQKALISRDPTYLSQIAERYEADMEVILSLDDNVLPVGIDKADLIAFREKTLSIAFSCRYPGCSEKTGLAFRSIVERHEHELTHSPQFQCSEELCFRKGIGFKKKQDFIAHMQRYHPSAQDKPVPEIPQLPSSSGTANRKIVLDATRIAEVGNALAKFSLDELPDGLKLVGPDWHAIFHPDHARTLDIVRLADIRTNSFISCAAISANSELVAIAEFRGVRLFEAMTGAPYNSSLSLYNDKHIASLCFTQHGHIVTGCSNGTILICNTENGATMVGCAAHDRSVLGLAISMSRSLIMSCSHDRTVKCWDAVTLAQKWAFSWETALESVELSEHDNFVVAMDDRGRILAWEIETGEKVAGSPWPREWQETGLRSLSVAPISNQFLTGYRTGTVKAWIPPRDYHDETHIRCQLTLTGHEVCTARVSTFEIIIHTNSSIVSCGRRSV